MTPDLRFLLLARRSSIAGANATAVHESHSRYEDDRGCAVTIIGDVVQGAAGGIAAVFGSINGSGLLRLDLGREVLEFKLGVVIHISREA